MLSKKSSNNLDYLSRYLKQHNLDIESSVVRSLLIKNSSNNEDDINKWKACKEELERPDEEQFTSILGDYIVGVLTLEQEAKKAKKIGPASELNQQEFNAVADDLRESGATYETLQGLSKNVANYKDSNFKKFGYSYEGGALPYGVCYYLLKDKSINKIASIDKHIMSEDFVPSSKEMNDAIKNTYLDTKAFKILKSHKPNYDLDDFYNTREFLKLCIDNEDIIKKSKLIAESNGQYNFIKNSWPLSEGLSNLGGSIGNAVTSTFEGVGGAIEWTYEKTLEYGGRMVDDIVEHGAEFFSALGTKLGSWVKNNPIIAGIIAAATWIWREVIIKYLPWIGVVYGLVMATKNIYYGWKAVKQLAEDERAHEFGLNTTISKASDFFNPSKAMKLPAKLEALAREDGRFLRELDDSEIPIGFDKGTYSETLTGDPEMLIRFIRICKQSRIFVIEMLGAPFHFLMAALDYLSILMWGGRLFVATPAAPLAIFVTLICEMLIMVGTMFVQHYVQDDKREDFEPLFETLENIVSANIHRLHHLDVDISIAGEEMEMHKANIEALIAILTERNRAADIPNEIEEYFEIEEERGAALTDEQKNSLRSIHEAPEESIITRPTQSPPTDAERLLSITNRPRQEPAN